MQQLSFGNGEVIFNEGQYARTMYEVKTGTVGIFGNYGAPNQVQLATLGTGEFFGEMGLVECYPRSATAVSLADGTTLDEINAEEFASYFKDKPETVLTIMRALCERLRETDKRYLEARRTVHDAIEAERGNQKKSKSLAERLTDMLHFGRRSR